MIDERNIQFTQFLTSRAEEIRHLTGVLESKQLKLTSFIRLAPISFPIKSCTNISAAERCLTTDTEFLPL